MTDKEKNFPLLRPNMDLEKNEIKDPLFWGEIQRLENFTNSVLAQRKPTKRKKVVVRALREILGARGTVSEIYKELNESLEEAHRFIQWIYKTYLPVRFEGVLNSDGLIAEENDFISLLKKRKNFLKDNSSFLRIREFEARRALLLTLILFDLKIHRKKLHLDGVSAQTITNYLERKFFTNTKIIKKTVLSFHDPANSFRVVFWHFKDETPPNLVTQKEGLKLKEIELSCREFQWENKTHLVYYASRDKTRFSHLIKMFRKDIRDPHASALDWRGFKLVFFSREALEDGLAKLRKKIFYLPGMTWKLEDGEFFKNFVNPFTSPRYQVKKFITTHNGEPCEIIVETIENHLNGILSCGDENHEFYRARALVNTALPLIFPTKLYQIDWKDKKIKKEIFDVIKGRLGNIGNK